MPRTPHQFPIVPNEDRSMGDLASHAETLRRLQELMALADPGAEPLSYGDDSVIEGAVGMPNNVVPALDPDQVALFEGLLNNKLASRQGQLFDDFQYMSKGFSPPDVFNMEEDQSRIQYGNDIASGLGRVFNPAGGPEGSFDPQRLGVEVGAPVMPPSAPGIELEVGMPHVAGSPSQRELMWADYVRGLLKSGAYGR